MSIENPYLRHMRTEQAEAPGTPYTAHQCRECCSAGHGTDSCSSMFVQATAGSLQSLCWASAAVGGVASSYFSGSLVEAWGPRGVFALTAAFPLVVSAAALLIDEQPATAGLRIKADRDTLRALFCP